ncbi:A disintegrin and metallo ase with thrombospondin motifs 3-like [Brachionus plicatilis]|uniref:A disintegrin and metallo ase with thrombospondin motifs 3-like n=1 Tax=Brachionus plicatilis TaxID=10195 RepID=A0A3M7SSC7_BRAPC|nr:A disintegrin and metallo ase with thrombospondin motifs 3-like [Brachionus plicatilis]
MLIVTDSSVFNAHRNFIGISNTDVVFLHMRHYFAHLIHGVNQRYQNSLSQDPDLRINIVLTNFLFLTDPAEQQWLNPQLVGEFSNPTFNGREVVLTTKTYNAFADYMNRKKFPFEFDHAAALFNKDLWSSDMTSTRSMTVGFASIGTICTQNKYSLSEEIGGFINLLVVAHEIAHGLGAFHDGIIGFSDQCPINNRDIMSPSLGGTSSHRFSPCSISMFKSTLLNKNLNSVASNANCLTNKVALSEEIGRIEDTDAGKFYSPDDLCRMIFGPSATYCQNKIESICRSLNCRANSSSSFCTPNYAGAPDGTLCASGKVCLKGECVTSSMAKTGSCVFKEDVITREVESEIQLPSPQISCLHYFNLLEIHGKSIASYCAKTQINNICCHSCRKYNALVCKDIYSNCPSDSGCNDQININGQLRFIFQVCPRTCNRCEPLSCADAPDICENGATCINTGSSMNKLFGFRCECRSGFTGEYCESKILSNPCNSNPCLNGGTCFSFTQHFYMCLCQSSCSGLNCASCLFNPMTTSPPLQLLQSSTQSGNCEDQSQFCSIFYQYCNDLAFFELKTIREVCPKTCQACPVTPCIDAQSNCAGFKILCQYFDVNYFGGNWITHPCYKTCGHC